MQNLVVVGFVAVLASLVVLAMILKRIIYIGVVIHRYLHGRVPHELVKHGSASLPEIFRGPASKPFPQSVHG